MPLRFSSRHDEGVTEDAEWRLPEDPLTESIQRRSKSLQQDAQGAWKESECEVPPVDDGEAHGFKLPSAVSVPGIAPRR